MTVKMPLTLSQDLGNDLLQQAERRGQTIEEYVDSLTDAVRNAPEGTQAAITEIAEQELLFVFSDAEAQELLAVSQLENVLPSSWIQSWREADNDARSKFIAVVVIGLIIFLFSNPNAKNALVDLLRRLSIIAQTLREEEQTRPVDAPAWLAEIRPVNPAMDGTNGLHRIVGAWPGEEGEEEIREALEHLS